MINKLDLSLLATRLVLGVVIFAHGAQKLFGWFGGFGFDATMQYFVQTGIPYFIGLLVIGGETLGALALILGFGGRFMASGIFIIMIGAMAMHLPNGFFMNWYGNQAGEGYEYHLLVFALSLIVIINGSGKYSLDNRYAAYKANKLATT